MARSIQLFQLPQEMNDCVYVSGKYPLLIDPLGQACQFLRYRARYLSIMKRGDFDKESLRKAVTQALHNGAWVVLDFDKLDIDLASLFDKDHFPEQVLSPIDLLLPETYGPLLRDSDEFAAKVTYEHQAALAEGAFQDRTKAHAPERVADIDKRFNAKDAFRLIVATKKEDVSEELSEKLTVMKVECTEQQAKENAGLWAGGEKPRAKKSKEQEKLDTDLLETAFDGDAEEVKKLLDKGADAMANDGRGNTPLSEAAVQGHLEACRVLLDWKKPIGSNANHAGGDGRTSVHRAAFQGHQEVVLLLLESGGDPRIKDRQGEKPYDLASNDETRKVLEEWDTAKTDKLKEERQVAQDEEDIKCVKNEEERIALERRKLTGKLCELAHNGEKDLLEIELMDIDHKQVGSYRDDGGNNILHIASCAGRLDVVVMLLEEICMEVNPRDAKGWTPVACAAFHGQKAVVKALMAKNADPMIENAYRKSAFDVAKDDEIKETLTLCQVGPASSSDAPAASGSTEEGKDGENEEKAKAKGKAKAKAKGEAKAKAKGEAKAKAAAGSAANAVKAKKGK
eukprot:TRINITY_DN22555_c0_g1_i1.p1 TRINITY_DN22555_c0_g1~~TRINITY_DN22555_c0_g1_i1.p1  ORF type:complete len:568 (+),score=160.07 TRINITY_DN22555_c0_g1_i1:94-1797(+)